MGKSKMDYSKMIEGARLGLRIFTSICLLVSVVVTATDKLALIDGTKASFDYFHGYRYVLSIGVIGLTYSLIQMGLGIYQMVKNKNKKIKILIAVAEFADLFLSWFLASAVGTGFGVTAELKNLADKLFEGDEDDDVDVSNVYNFLNQGNTATGILFVAFISMALIVILSSFTRYYHQTAESVSVSVPVPVQTNDVEAQAQAQVVAVQTQVQVVD